MIIISLIIYVIAVLLTVFYLVRRLGMNFTASSLLVIALLLLHGPAYIHYCWGYGPGTLIYDKAMANGDPEEILTTLTVALSVMFLGIIIGMELLTRAFPRSADVVANTIRYWQWLPIRQIYRINYRALFVGSLLIAIMLAVTVHENQIDKILAYLHVAGDEFDKIMIRQELGGSRFYLYNIILYALAPFFTIACMAAWRVTRNNLVLMFGLLIFAVVLVGKLSTLSKAPVVIFILQLMLANLAFKRNRLTSEGVIMIALATLALFVWATLLAIPGIGLIEAINFLYYRIFMISNEVLVEYFAAIPEIIDFSWGQGIRLVTEIIGDSAAYLPAYTAVAEVTRDSQASTSTAMFIGDAWAEFSWFGVFMFSVLFGVLVRSIDFYAFRHGKTDEAIAIVAGITYGIFTALSTSLTTAMLSGGLLTVPLLSWLLTVKILIRPQKNRTDTGGMPLTSSLYRQRHEH